MINLHKRLRYIRIIYILYIIEMVTNDPVKNREFVKKSQQKKKEQIGVGEFNRIHNEKQATYRQNLINQKGIEEVRREKAEYMRQYRLKQKQDKQKNEAIIKIQNALKGHKARKEVINRFNEKYTPKLHNPIDFLNKNASTIQNNYRMKLARQKTFEKIADGFLMPTI